MNDLHEALAEISQIRTQIARSTEFQGYGPGSVAASGMLALVVAIAQARWPASLNTDIHTFLAVWIATAAISLSLTAIETVLRSKRVHTSFANEMIYQATKQFLPALAAGLLLTVVMVRFSSSVVAMLPGLWQVIFSLGIFASCQFLPRQMYLVGMWYLAAGVICIALWHPNAALSPWSMGVPFGVGQILVAAVLQFGYRERHE
jgi:hypothetical protein